MPSPLSGALNKARMSFGGPLGGFQGPQTMQMPRRRPMPMGGGLPPTASGMPSGMPIGMPSGMPSGMPIGMPSGMLPQTPVSAPMTGGGMPAMPMGGGASSPFGPQASGNTGIIPPHMQRGLTGSKLADVMRRMKLNGMIKVNPFDQPSMPSAPPGAQLA